MATFPILKSGAAAQYPLERAVRFKTQSVEFLDGSRQRYALQGRALRSWKVKLDLLDDEELGALAAFVEQAGTGPFLFTDPVTGDSSIRCIFAGDAFDSALDGEMVGRARLLIREIV